MINKNGQFNREKVPERVVHARGMTAKGFFEVCSIDLDTFGRTVLHNNDGAYTNDGALQLAQQSCLLESTIRLLHHVCRSQTTLPTCRSLICFLKSASR